MACSRPPAKKSSPLADALAIVSGKVNEQDFADLLRGLIRARGRIETLLRARGRPRAR